MLSSVHPHRILPTPSVTGAQRLRLCMSNDAFNRLGTPNLPLKRHRTTTLERICEC